MRLKPVVWNVYKAIGKTETEKPVMPWSVVLQQKIDHFYWKERISQLGLTNGSGNR